MSVQTSAIRITAAQADDSLVATRLGIIQRLADPYLTDHDRWVLGQFARFLSGHTPHPDPRVVRARPRRPARPTLYSRVRRATL